MSEVISMVVMASNDDDGDGEEDFSVHTTISTGKYCLP